jgi:FdhD protein
MDPFTPITGPVSEKGASSAIVDTSVERATGLDFRQTEEFLAVEEPLEIQLAYGPANARAMKSISVTMRTC